MLDKLALRKLVNENFSLLSILIGIILVSLSIGPFQNDDTAWEYQATVGVVKWGMPYVISWGNIMNQPPVGFYVEALFFKIFGSQINTDVILITLFGLGSIILVYKIGKELYGKSTGLFAAALFALTPWELVLSRSFLIDAQCLFLSLLCILIGIISIRKGSFKLFMVTAALFAAAFLTKFFAVFMLIPLVLFYVHFRPKKLKQGSGWFGVFFIPVLLFSFLWYQIISAQGILHVFKSSDFTGLNPIGVAPSPFFIGTFLEEFGLGIFFILAVVFSLLICFSFRKTFTKTFTLDLICLVTILIILGVDFFLGFNLNLNAPYLNAVKYDYQSLPFFSLLAASLASKSVTLFKSAKLKTKLKKALYFSTALTGAILLAATIVYSVLIANVISTLNYLQLRVGSSFDLGYSFFNYSPIGYFSSLMYLQYLGFVLVLFGLLWASRHTLGSLLRLSHNS